MGWCHEFGPQVGPVGCDHPMRAGSDTCTCLECGTVCHGRYAGCQAVWARGPREVHGLRVASETPVRLPFAVPTPSTPVAPQPVVYDDDFELLSALLPPLTSEPLPLPSEPLPPEPPADPAPRVDKPTPATAVAAALADDGRADILDWLQSAFGGVRSELRMLSSATERTHEALLALAEAAPAVAVAAEPLASPPLSIAPPPPPPAVVDEELRALLAAVHESARGLQDEMHRMAAFRAALADDLPWIAEAADAAIQRADRRLAALTATVTELGEAPAWEEALRSLAQRVERNE